MKYSAGFTLIEMLIVTAIIGIMVPPLYYITVTPLRTYAVETERDNLFMDYDKVHRILDRDIRAAKNILSSIGDIQSSTTSLVLELPKYNYDLKRFENEIIYYHLETDPVSNNYIFWRDEFTNNLEIKKKSYPVSRILSGIEFKPISTQWENSNLISMGLKYNKSIAHTDLQIDRKVIIALRGR